MKKTVAFCQNKGIDIVKLRCTLPNLADICQHSSITAKLYPFTESDKKLLSEIGEGMFGRQSLVFTREIVVDKTHTRKSTIVCKTIGGKDASQL